MSAQVKTEYTLEGLYELVKQVHNPDLVIKDASPNGNTIFHIYNDGEITYQKGGWAYGQRSVATDKYPFSNKKFDSTRFPIQGSDIFGKTIGHAIATEQDCYRVRNYMNNIS